MNFRLLALLTFVVSLICFLSPFRPVATELLQYCQQ
jgi:hypothetical protein